MIEETEKLYPLRIADDVGGERCVSVDDLTDWILSIADEGEFEDETYEFAHFLIDKLLYLKTLKI